MILTYNNSVVNRLVEYTRKILERIEASYNAGATISLSKFEVIDSNNLNINYLMTHGLTGSFTARMYFKIKIENEDEVESYDELEVPKIINNVFVIDGDMRVPTNELDNDDAVTVYNANIRINERVNFRYEENPIEPGGYEITLNLFDDDSEPVITNFTSDAEQTYHNYLKLTSDEIDKLKVKLDTDDIPDYITRDLILRLIKRGPDKKYDNLIDKKIYSPESNLLRYLNGNDIRRKILSGMKSKFIQYKTIYLRDIQNAINTYFKVASEKGISIPSTVNPLIFDALKYKVMISKNVAYNDTMTDVIDIVNTPINANSNKINELNVCTEIINDEIYIKCYTYPKQNDAKIKYVNYCTKKVLINQFWDYDKKTFKDPSKPIKYKLRNKIYEGTVDTDYDLIEPKPDDKLSITTRRIPLINMSDFGRLAMGTAMSKQSTELYNSEPSLVGAGHDGEDYKDSTLMTKHQGSQCTVTLIKDNKVYLKDVNNGSVTFVDIPAPTRGINDTLISFKSKVKVGDTVRDGDVIVEPYMLRRGSFELGVNTRVIYMSYLGFA